MLDILSWFFAGVFSFLFILIIFHAFKINSINHNHVVLSIMCVFLIFFSVAYERLDEIPAPWNEMHVIKLRNRLTSKEMEQLIKLQRLILNLEIEESVQAPAPYLDEQIEHMKRKILEINWKLDFLKMIKHHVRDALKILDFRELSRELNLLEVEEEPSPYVYYWRARRAFYFSRNIDEAKCILDKGLKKFNSHTDLLFFRGLLEHMEGNFKEAIDKYQKILSIDGTKLEVLNSLSYLYSTIYIKEDLRNQFQDKIEDFKKQSLELAQLAVEVSGGTDHGVLDTAAVAYCVNGKFDKAIELEEKAIRLVTGNSNEYQDNLKKLKQGECPMNWQHVGRGLSRGVPNECS